MSLATWWRHDPLPPLPFLAGLEVRVAIDAAELARVNGLSPAAVRARWQSGHRAYLGYWDGRPVTYGWVATRSASIGELDLAFALPAEDRYLWDFATLPDWQGRGLYPRLLQALITELAGEAQRLWIIHAPENLPSGAGIHKAGFGSVGQLSFRAAGGVGLAPLGPARRALAGADLLGVPVSDTALAPCWMCGGAVQTFNAEAAVENCWPPRRLAASPCCCARPVKPSPHP